MKKLLFLMAMFSIALVQADNLSCAKAFNGTHNDGYIECMHTTY